MVLSRVVLDLKSWFYFFGFSRWVVVVKKLGRYREAQRCWLVVKERLLELDADAIDAARYIVDEDDVLRSIDRLEEALDQLVATVPATYR